MRLLKAVLLVALSMTFWQTTATAIDLRIPLRKLASVQDHRLRGTMDSISFTIPVPQRWSVRSATIHFSYVNSSALVPDNSRLVFHVGGQPLAQVRLNPDAPEGEVSVPIPGALLKEGYTPCSFWVSQHYTEEHCEDPFAPELWTWVKLSDAYLVFDAEPVAVPLRVSAIADFLFDARNIFDTRVNIVIPELTPAGIKAAALAAAGISLRYDYRVPEISLSDALRPGMDNILIAPRSQLAATGTSAAATGNGPVLSVQPLPEKRAAPAAGGQAESTVNPHRGLVTITGGDDAELMTAARAFAALSYPLPDSPLARISDLKLPEIGDHMMNRGLRPGNSFTFGSLGVRTTEFRNYSPPPLHLDLRLPSDLYLSPNKFASIVLHMAYDAAMREDSVLNIRLNGKFISGVRLDNPRGDHFRAYKLDIPLSSFKAGTNRLSFEAALTPLHTDKCKLIQTENLRLTIFEDSAFVLPQVPYWIKMPQLEVFFQDAFPLAQWPDLSQAAVVLTDRNWSTANAAVNLIALVAQKIGYPPFELTWLFDTAVEQINKDLLIAGPLATLPKAILAQSPIAGIDPMRITFPQFDRPRPRTAEPIQFWPLTAPMQPDAPQNVSDLKVPSAAVGETSGSLGPGRAVLMQLQHPGAAERTVLVLTAAGPADVLAGSRAFWSPSVQSACRGDLTVVNLEKPDYDTLAHQIGPSYYLGTPGRAPGIQNFINSHPLFSLAVLLLLLVAMCLLILRVLRKRRRQRLAAAG